MKHELLDLYNAACESKDEDVIKAFQQARDRIGPQIAVDLVLENEAMRKALRAWMDHVTICDEADEDSDEGFMQMLHSRTKAIELTLESLGEGSASSGKEH